MLSKDTQNTSLPSGIVVLSAGRSGSSLVAGLLAHHGIWTGDCLIANRFNPKGYFENIEIKNAMLKLYGRDWQGEPPEYKEGWLKTVEKIKNRQECTGRWLFKCGAFYWRVWKPFNPVFVKVWRDPKDILKSYERTRFLKNRYTHEEIGVIINRHQNLMHTIDGPNIDADALVNGETGQFRKMLRDMGLKYDESNDFVDRKFWNEND
jgi:hypothetical protein